jgi:hypothetical protein
MRIKSGFLGSFVRSSVLMVSVGMAGLLAQPSPAHATDAFNKLAPSAVNQLRADNPLVFALSTTGKVCYINLLPPSNTAWTCLAAGLALRGVTLISGPAGMVIKDGRRPTAFAPWSFAFVVGRSGTGRTSLYESHMQAGGTWSAFNSLADIVPPTGMPTSYTSAPGAGNSGSSSSLAVRGPNNVISELNATLDMSGNIVWGSWLQAATDNSTSGPALAVSSYNRSLIALGPMNNARWTTCGASCFQIWNNLDAGVKTFNEGPGAYTFGDPTTPMAGVASTSAGHVFYGREDLSRRTFTGFTDIGSANGTAADSAPAVIGYGSTETLVVVHANNGKYEWRNVRSDQPTWTFLPAMP